MTCDLHAVLALLQARPDLRIEVQGHTDDVGSDEYKQTLSEARAASVVTWLGGRGVALNRLSARGYGMKMPVADNNTDEAALRIAGPNCKAAFSDFARAANQ